MLKCQTFLKYIFFERQYAVFAFFWLGQNCPNLEYEESVRRPQVEAAHDDLSSECIGKVQKNS